MKTKPYIKMTNEELDRMALDTTDIRPMSSESRRRWAAAQRTGKKIARGRPGKSPADKSRIVPVSIDPILLAEADRFAKSAGISRSRLVAEGLRLRINSG